MTPIEILVAILCSLIIIFGFTAFTGAPFVPSKTKDIKKAFKEVYKLSSKDTIIDLGAGNGKVVKIAAEEFGAKAYGIELNPILATYAKFRVRHLKNAKIVCKDFFRFVFPTETTAVYIFGESRDLKKFRRKIEREAERIGHSIKLISYAFAFSDLDPVSQNDMYFCYEIGKDKPTKSHEPVQKSRSHKK